MTKINIKQKIGGLFNIPPKKDVVVLDAKKYNELMGKIKFLKEVKTY